MQETPQSDPPRRYSRRSRRPRCGPPTLQPRAAELAPPLPHPPVPHAPRRLLDAAACALPPAGPATWSTPALLTQLGLTSAANPLPCLRLRFCRERKSGPPQAPPQPPIACFGATTGGACEETERLRGRTLPSLPGCRARPIRGVLAVRGWGLPLRSEHGPAHYFLLVGAVPQRVYPG